MKKVIYYFSGTGNSMRAAVRIGEALHDTELISMRCDPREVSSADADVIGFVFPVYHWTLCEPIDKFIRGLEVNSKAYIFAISTPSFINGFAFEALDKLLREKGARLNYAKRLFCVANLAIVYPPFPWPSLRVPRTERSLTRLSAGIVQRKTNRYAHAGLLTKLIYPKMMPKYRDVQNDVDRGFFIKDSCVSCGLCAKVCPKNNIQLAGGVPTFTHNCCSCMACVSYCPKKAIGYALPKDVLAMIDTPFTRRMKLPDKRLRYRNPHITAADLAKDRLHID